MKKRNRLIVLCGACVMALAMGCVGQPGERDMNQLASALTKVTAAVDASLLYWNMPDDEFGKDMLDHAVAYDPQMLLPFANYTVRVQWRGDETVLLVCRHDTGHAVLEDAACTPGLDLHRWRAAEPEDCHFTLDMRALCQP